MRISLVVEADYTDLTDKDALSRDKLVANLKLLAQRIEVDYREHNSQQNKYGVFYQIYKLTAGATPKRLRSDSASQAILDQLDLALDDPTILPKPKKDS